MASAPAVAELLDGHMTLDVECCDRRYLNAYLPALQTGGGVARCLREHRGHPIPAPALFARMGDALRRGVADFCRERGVPLVRFKAGERKLEVRRPRLEAAGEPGVVAVGTAQAIQSLTMGHEVGRTPAGVPHLGFGGAERRVSVSDFSIHDAEWGPGSLTLCASFPDPGTVWLHGHQGAKRQLSKRGSAFTALGNGLASGEDRAALAAISRLARPRRRPGLVRARERADPPAAHPGRPRGRR